MHVLCVMLSVVGCHAEGEVGDVIVGGFLPRPGATMFERMRAVDRLDTAVEVAGLEMVAVDVAYGGILYAIVDARSLQETGTCFVVHCVIPARRAALAMFLA